MNNLIAICGVTCAGKNTVLKEARNILPVFETPISFTTRSPRAGEQDGREYHFVSRNQFEEMRSQGEFIESAEVHGNLYGTSRKAMESALERGNVLYDIDVQGALQLKKIFPQIALIFISAPMDHIKRRLQTERTVSEEEMYARLATARWEMTQIGEFDFEIENPDNGLEVAVSDFVTVVGQILRRKPTAVA